MARYLIFTPDEIPVQKTFEIGNTDYSYRLQHNEIFDFLTLTILDREGVILYSNKLVYRNDVLSASRYLFPEIIERLLPYDPNNRTRVLTIETLDNPVRIYIL